MNAAAPALHFTMGNRNNCTASPRREKFCFPRRIPRTIGHDEVVLRAALSLERPVLTDIFGRPCHSSADGGEETKSARRAVAVL